MTFGIIQTALIIGAAILLARPLGGYIARVFEGERVFLTPLLEPVEHIIYRVGGESTTREQGWRAYAVALLAFNLVGMLVLFAILRFQGALPFNPAGFDGVPTYTAFNIAVSFVTNTNWQSYGAETTLSYFSQMAGLTVQNFVSAATGIAVAAALIRGIARRRSDSVGNFWRDLTRSTVYILLPISLLVSAVLLWEGVPQNLDAYTTVATVEGAEQVIAQGPVASQEGIKQIGTNGGGFFNVNSAHPYENPTPFSNAIEILSMLLIPAALTYTFGRMVKNQAAGWSVLAAMTIILVAAFALVWGAEEQPNPAVAIAGVEQALNMEGKETRFGGSASALWSVVTTATSSGPVNSMHDSFNAISGFALLGLMQLGEVIFGGVGVGLTGMLGFAILTVFLAGLMVGRTPEFLGKKIEGFEVKMAVLPLISFPLFLLGLTSLSIAGGWAQDSMQEGGPHGFSEVLYAFTSGTGNNGSAFAGFGAGTPFFNTTIGIAMLAGRFLMIVPTLALAGSLARKPMVPAGAGTFPVSGPLWTGLLVSVVLIVGLLTFFPALALGPIADQTLPSPTAY